MNQRAKGDMMGERKRDGARNKGVKGSKGAKGGTGRRRVRRKGVPPADSPVWPEQYRGRRWKSIYGVLFAGKCQLCAYSFDLPKSRQLLDKFHGVTRLLLCSNHPSEPGGLIEVLPLDTCRNFATKRWQRPRAKSGGRRPCPKVEGATGDVRRIPLGGGRFTTVDEADYEEISKYKWYANRRGSTVYATCKTDGKGISMHRMIMQPHESYVVDHIDGNGLNNRRCNLRVCTLQQNQANRGPCGGSSQFVGVHRHGDKWQASIRYQGEYFYLGLHEDEVEAAKTRDRKAYELRGEYAYLNFPEIAAER